MKIIYGLTHLERYPAPVVALGVFDGMHVAHRRLISAAVKKARAIQGTSIVVTFWPHPQRQQSLYSLSHRLRLIAQLGVDVAVVVRFSRFFSQLPCGDFVKNILARKIHAAYVYVGANFRFGRGARGTSALLGRLAKAWGFKVRIFDVMSVDGRRVSSTLIRNLITDGKLDKARVLLRRPVGILGSVVKGAALGRCLGFPTANIDPHHEIVPPSGIYAVKVVVQKKRLPGICYIGTRSTFTRRLKNVIEVHIFDFKSDIYGQDLEIQFIKKIREDRSFPCASLLAQQIKKDIAAARAILHP